MTVDTNTSSDIALPDDALPWDIDHDDSLDEITPEDIPTPRLRVIPAEQVFENADTGERYEELECIILGLARARVFWPPEMEDDSEPFCRSQDAKTGYPNVADDVPVKKQFPWKRSNFDRKDLPVVEGTDQPIIQCSECIFSKWDDENDKPAPCSEVLNLPVFYLDKHGVLNAAILTFKRSGFRPTMRYLGAMKQAKQSPFMYYTTIKLQAAKRGEVDYSVPKFFKGEMTEAGENNQNWIYYHQTWQQIRSFLRRPRSLRTEVDEDLQASQPDVVDAEVEEEAPKAPPKERPAAKKAAPKTKPEPEPAGDVTDDVPWPEEAPADEDDLF